MGALAQRDRRRMRLVVLGMSRRIDKCREGDEWKRMTRNVDTDKDNRERENRGAAPILSACTYVCGYFAYILQGCKKNLGKHGNSSRARLRADD